MEQGLNCKKEPLGRGVSVFVSEKDGFGTDAVLLSHFAEPRKKDKACDLGTGCGIIPLLWCKGDAPLHSFAVELRSEASDLAEMSVKENGLEDRITVINRDLRELSGIINKGSLNLVTCNPPYKKVGAGIRCEDTAHDTARHETAGTLEDIVKVASSLLMPSGRFCLCLRPERLAETIVLFHDAGLEPKRLRMVAKTPGCEPWLFLIEGRKNGNSGLRVLPTLFVHKENGDYSDEMLEIYSDYKNGAR